VYIQIQWAGLGYWNFGRDFGCRMAQVAFQVEVELFLMSAVWVGLEEVRPCPCASSLSVDSWRCHFGKEGSRQFDFDKPLPGVVLLQLSPFYAQEIQHPASSLPRLLREASKSAAAFPLSRLAKTLLQPFSPYSTPGACLTVLAVPDLLALP